ncbi:uncharacterized protein J7T54_002491 [Emericellopsis cladophorae]|uniref:BAR domain-containing protein n=1 Tax=Emericellopsis cladophorae TaxID=2686198 RepID=A0A9P9Y0J8_9HYPO|nr:uncharacterized protein J7T54_002491 [Emericellopsis cladophorae]KAI6781135.1 hypothetical protein J7T54_002491 [Emericellopsis cladophorae]
MHLTKKFDRAFQWAGEKMGGEARTAQPEDFKSLEADMAIRQQGIERLQKGVSSYTRWISRRCDALEDRERASPMGLFGRTMAAHGEEYGAESELGNSFVAIGQAHERVAGYQEVFHEQVNNTWGESLESSVAMMKEYQAARKKLENRRLAYDASTAKLNKARRDDFRIEEEVRNNKAKFEESSEDVFQRMQDIKEAEADSVLALNDLLEAELEFHERCVEELRRARETIDVSAGGAGAGARAPPRVQKPSPPRTNTLRPAVRSRSNTARSWQESRSSAVYEEPELESEQAPTMPPRLRNISSGGIRGSAPAPPQPPRPNMSRALTADPRPVPRSSAPPLPLTRVRTDGASYGGRADDVFGDDASTASGSGSPDYGERSLSPATSYGSLNRSTGALALNGVKKAPPPPPPVNRAKKPAPPVPARRENLKY